MPNKKISQLNINTSPTPLDALPIDNNGETKQIFLSGLTEYVNSDNLANLGFIVRPRPINKDVILPDNSDVVYIGTLDMGNGAITIPNGSTLTIGDLSNAITHYTPSGSTDTNGASGNITWDDQYLYWKTSTQWLRISGQTF
jgi:hypothetical protein